MSLFKREHRSSWTGEPPIPAFPGMSGFSGGSTAPSTDQALQVSAVWACVRLLASSVSMMPLHAFTMREGIRVPIPDPPLLVKPSSDASMHDFVYMTMVSLLLRGNAYGQIVSRDSYGKPVQIELFDPDRVEVHVDTSGGVTYKTRAGGLIPTAEMWHVRAYRMPGSPVGLSPIKYAAQSINTDRAVSAFALGYFTDAPHPASVITSDQSINQEQAKTIKERIRAAVIGREPLVLGAGLTFDHLSVSPEESQFLATQKLGVAGVARVYGVPPEMIAAEAGNSLTYANIEQKGVDFLTFSVQDWISLLESSFAPLMPGKQHARFETNVLIRADLETRVKAGAIAIASFQQTPDEVRAWPGNDMAPLTDDQLAAMKLIPLKVSPTGMPRSVPVALTPTIASNADPAATDGNPDA